MNKNLPINRNEQGLCVATTFSKAFKRALWECCCNAVCLFTCSLRTTSRINIVPQVSVPFTVLERRALTTQYLTMALCTLLALHLIYCLLCKVFTSLEVFMLQTEVFFPQNLLACLQTAQAAVLPFLSGSWKLLCSSNCSRGEQYEHAPKHQPSTFLAIPKQSGPYRAKIHQKTTAVQDF